MEQVIRDRLEQLVASPALRELMLQIAADDMRSVAARSHCMIIPALGGTLGAHHQVIEAFSMAWQLMYAAICRLDDLQDGDPTSDCMFASLPSGLQYQLVFSSYLLATSFLDDLIPEHLSVPRIARLRRLWTAMMFQAASGQYQDLTTDRAESDHTHALADYQALTHEKAGPLFSLAFGGGAALASDDEELGEALVQVGELYGALVQYHDDVVDGDQQPNRGWTLSTTLMLARPDLQEHADEACAAFLTQIYHAYVAHAAEILAPWPLIKAGILGLFPSAFGHQLPAVERASC